MSAAVSTRTGRAIELRPMRTKDLVEVRAIEKLVHPRPWSEELFRQELRQADRRYLVATVPTGRGVGGRRHVIVGYGGVQVVIDEAHILNVAAHPAWRRVGIGARLVLELIGEAARRDAAGVTLEVRKSNTVARSLYASWGFDEEGTRTGYYGDNMEDAQILWLRGLDRADVRERLRAAAGRRGFAVPSSLKGGG